MVLSILLAVALLAQPDPWAPVRFLIGEWAGEGSGQPGQGSGGFSFRPDLQDKILVRKSYADYPATKERAAYRHDDLMILYREAGKLQAVYFDNEGHIIRYAVHGSADGGAVEFLSEPAANTPRYRFTYTRTGAATLGLKFEVAPPGKPDAFATYVEAKARRAGR